jgi:hypothetical protein
VGTRGSTERAGLMAGRGAVPKLHPLRDADGARRRAEFTQLTPDDIVRGPDLPPGIDWPEQTQALYEALRRDPIAQALTDADWHHVIDTMSLHRLLWTDEPSNAIKVASEVRLRLAQLGITPESRLRLRMLIASPDERAEQLRPHGMTPERKARLLKAVEQTTDQTKGTP